jgi:hypothetical protein
MDHVGSERPGGKWRLQRDALLLFKCNEPIMRYEHKGNSGIFIYPVTRLVFRRYVVSLLFSKDESKAYEMRIMSVCVSHTNNF